MVADHPKDPILWKNKAIAFVTRCHRHLWGKNNEDPQVFLFRQDLANQFVKQMHLGWNKHGQERSWDKWGLESKKTESPPNETRENIIQADTLILPPGIVIPYIVEKELLSLWIHPLDPSGIPCLVPGSTGGPIRFGNQNNPVKKVNDLFEGLRLFQAHQKTLCVEISV